MGSGVCELLVRVSLRWRRPTRAHTHIQSEAQGGPCANIPHRITAAAVELRPLDKIGSAACRSAVTADVHDDDAIRILQTFGAPFANTWGPARPGENHAWPVRGRVLLRTPTITRTRQYSFDPRRCTSRPESDVFSPEFHMGLDLGKSIVSMTDIHTVDSQPPMIQPQTLVQSERRGSQN